MAKKTESQVEKVQINDIGWTDYVLSLLSEDEKISGNPTTDGLRRIFEIALNCFVVDSTSEVVQCPTPENEKRATVVHSLTYILKDVPVDSHFNTVTVNGAADVYWGNCDKLYRNHPVAVAETRAEGRALRRGLKLRKVLAAEEVADSIEDNPDAYNTNKISSNQINFIDIIAQRLDINILSLLDEMSINKNVKNLMHDEALSIIRKLSSYQQDLSAIGDGIKGYQESWKYSEG